MTHCKIEFRFFGHSRGTLQPSAGKKKCRNRVTLRAGRLYPFGAFSGAGGLGFTIPGVCRIHDCPDRTGVNPGVDAAPVGQKKPTTPSGLTAFPNMILQKTRTGSRHKGLIDTAHHATGNFLFYCCQRGPCRTPVPPAEYLDRKVKAVIHK